MRTIIPILVFSFTTLGAVTGCGEKGPAYTGKTAFPSVELTLVNNGQTINTAQAKAGQPTLVFVFSPDCVHCKTITADLLQHITSFRNCNLYMVSPFSMEELKQFYATNQLNRYANIVVGRDSKAELPGYYNMSSVPFIALYDADKKLVQVISGEARATDIQKMLFN